MCGELWKRAGLMASLVATLSAPTLLAQDAVARDTVTLDFEEADIRAVVSALAELMGVSVTYGAIPARPVTLKSNRPVPSDSLIYIFRSLVETNGLHLVEEAGIFRVTSADVAPPPHERSAGPPGQVGLFVVRLRHAHAVEVAGILSELFGGGRASVGARPGLPGGLSEQLREGLIPPEMPEGTGRAGAGRADPLRAQVKGDVSIVPDPATNSLFIRSSAEDYSVIEAAIEQLDVRPLQVLIEVLIAEVRKDALTEIGLQVLLPQQSVDGVGGVQVEGELNERTLGNLVVRILQTRGARLDALVEALSSRSDVTILSRPVLLASNNQEARILVGSERPFIQVSRALPTDAPIRDQVIQFRDVGTKLTLVPTINYDGYVTLSVLQEVSQATAETQFGAPVISTRETATRLLVRDGQTAVLGGLIDHQKERVRSGIPLLKDLPLLGILFGSSRWRTVETELFLFLTPHVLATDQDVDSATRRMRDAGEDLRRHIPKALYGPARDSLTAPDRPRN